MPLEFVTPDNVKIMAKARKAGKLPQASAAAMIGVTHDTWKSWESGRRRMPIWRFEEFKNKFIIWQSRDIADDPAPSEARTNATVAIQAAQSALRAAVTLPDNATAAAPPSANVVPKYGRWDSQDKMSPEVKAFWLLPYPDRKKIEDAMVDAQRIARVLAEGGSIPDNDDIIGDDLMNVEDPDGTPQALARQRAAAQTLERANKELARE